MGTQRITTKHLQYRRENRMRDNLHQCYSCTAEAVTLCQGCSAKSCLDHLTATKVPYAYPLLCSGCVDKQQSSAAIVYLCLFIGFFVMLAAASAGG